LNMWMVKELSSIMVQTHPKYNITIFLWVML
jgi:hypothetical protein